MHIYYSHTSNFSRVSEIWCAFSVEFFEQAGGWPSTEGQSCVHISFHSPVNVAMSLPFSGLTVGHQHECRPHHSATARL